MKAKQKNVSLWMIIFKEVIDQGSFTEAADRLNLTKSGVSQHINHLEQHFGVQLLIRSTRSLSLTSAGQRVFQRSGELKTLLNITIDEVNNLKQQPSGLLRITAPQALMQPAVLPALQQLVNQFPNIKPCLIVDDNIQDIIKKGIDVAIRVGELQDCELRARKIGSLNGILVASSAYLSSLEKPITVKNINTHPFIATSWQTTNLSHCFVCKNNQRHDVFLKPKFEVNSAVTAMELVLLDLGVALLPNIYVNKYIREGKIQHILNDLQADIDNIYYVHAYKKNVPLKIKWFIEFLSKQL